MDVLELEVHTQRERQMNQGASDTPSVPLLLRLPLLTPTLSHLSLSLSLSSLFLYPSLSPPARRVWVLTAQGGSHIEVGGIHFQKHGLGPEHTAPEKPWSPMYGAALDDRWQRC